MLKVTTGISQYVSSAIWEVVGESDGITQPDATGGDSECAHWMKSRPMPTSGAAAQTSAYGMYPNLGSQRSGYFSCVFAPQCKWR